MVFIAPVITIFLLGAVALKIEYFNDENRKKTVTLEADQGKSVALLRQELSVIHKEFEYSAFCHKRRRKWWRFWAKDDNKAYEAPEYTPMKQYIDQSLTFSVDYIFIEFEDRCFTFPACQDTTFGQLKERLLSKIFVEFEFVIDGPITSDTSISDLGIEVISGRFLSEGQQIQDTPISYPYSVVRLRPANAFEYPDDSPFAIVDTATFVITLSNASVYCFQDVDLRLTVRQLRKIIAGRMLPDNLSLQLHRTVAICLPCKGKLSKELSDEDRLDAHFLPDSINVLPQWFITVLDLALQASSNLQFTQHYIGTACSGSSNAQIVKRCVKSSRVNRLRDYGGLNLGDFVDRTLLTKSPMLDKSRALEVRLRDNMIVRIPLADGNVHTLTVGRDSSDPISDIRSELTAAYGKSTAFGIAICGLNGAEADHLGDSVLSRDEVMLEGKPVRVLYNWNGVTRGHLVTVCRNSTPTELSTRLRMSLGIPDGFNIFLFDSPLMDEIQGSLYRHYTTLAPLYAVITQYASVKPNPRQSFFSWLFSTTITLTIKVLDETYVLIRDVPLNTTVSALRFLMRSQLNETQADNLLHRSSSICNPKGQEVNGEMVLSDHLVNTVSLPSYFLNIFDVRTNSTYPVLVCEHSRPVDIIPRALVSYKRIRGLQYYNVRPDQLQQPPFFSTKAIPLMERPIHRSLLSEHPDPSKPALIISPHHEIAIMIRDTLMRPQEIKVPADPDGTDVRKAVLKRFVWDGWGLAVCEKDGRRELESGMPSNLIDGDVLSALPVFISFELLGMPEISGSSLVDTTDSGNSGVDDDGNGSDSSRVRKSLIVTICLETTIGELAMRFTQMNHAYKSVVFSRHPNSRILSVSEPVRASDDYVSVLFAKVSVDKKVVEGAGVIKLDFSGA